MISTHKKNTQSFDRSYNQELAIARPESYKHLFAILDNPDHKFIARGGGLSYAPGSFIKDGISISSELFNRLLGFDNDTGIVRCEAGIKLFDLLSVVKRAGWTLPILPGYPSITVGGCVAFNIHGKSQFHTGNFIDCVHSINLYHPKHGEQELSRNINRDLFELTIGGMGLTGFITEVALKLSPLNYKSIDLHKHKVSSIYEGIDFLRSEAENYKAVYSWHNFMKTGKEFGRGVVYCEQNSENQVTSKPFKSFYNSDSKPLPINMLNYFSTGIMNRVYELKDSVGGKESTIDIQSGSFPIYGKEIYYSLFGKQGFLEYQFISSNDSISDVIKEIEKWVKKNKQAVSLASLKLFKGKESLLNFCDSGVCLALDVPRNSKALKFFSFLDQLCIESRSIMNIAKDSRVSKQTIEQVYPEYSKFIQRIDEYDPDKIFNSEIRSRLAL